MAWEKLGSTTLASAGDTIATSTFTAKTFIHYLSHMLNSGATEAQFHDDNVGTGTLYAFRFSGNGAADTTATAREYIKIEDGTTESCFVVGYMINISANEKLHIHFVLENTAGAATAPNRVEVAGKYAQTSSQVVELDIDNIGAGDFSIDSNLTVLGTD